MSRLLGLVYCLVCWLGSFAFSSAHGADDLRMPYGVTRQQTTLTAQVDPRLLDVESSATRVLIITGLSGSLEQQAAAQALVDAITSEIKQSADLKSAIALSVVHAPDPDRSAGEMSFPPTGKAYDDARQPESVYLWRWLGMVAPDVVLIVAAGDAPQWFVPGANQTDASFTRELKPQVADAEGSLSVALSKSAPADVGTIPAVRVVAKQTRDLSPFFQQLAAKPVRSSARQELIKRQQRSPLDVARQLSQVYGHQLNDVSYIPALSVAGRVRLAELLPDEQQLSDVLKIVEPYRSGQKESLNSKSNGSQIAGHVVFTELARRTQDSAFQSLAVKAANMAFDAEGKPLVAMPTHSEMSDAVFMGTPILAQAAALTQDSKYREMALRHLQFMVKLNRRSDGLHQHSPLDPGQTAWGRGNGFVALGQALALSELPPTSPEHAAMLALYRDHLQAMRPHQDETGMWHQVVDHPESYREFTVTCMTSFAIVRGLRRGWLDRETYEPRVRRAWTAIQRRTASNGGLIDVCTGTGKMKSLREYLDRPAILGKDDRGGAMVFMLSTEIEYAIREGALKL